MDLKLKSNNHRIGHAMPSSTLVAAAEAAPPLRRRQRWPFESVTLSLPMFSSLVLPPRDWAVLPSRDWAGLPPALISSILHRLDHVQIMLGPDKVCRSWRRAARDEPELWRRIDMRRNRSLSDRNLIDLNQMAVEAVGRSQGQCQAFSGQGDGLHDEFIHYLGDQAPSLKRLILVSCHKLSDQGFMHAIKGFPLLEELHLSMRWDWERARVFEVIAEKCPSLKHLTVYSYIVDKEAMAIAGMHQLRSLQLNNDYDLTDQGLVAILDNCIHLKSLDLLNRYNIQMTPEMEARIKTKKLLMNYSSDGRRWDSFREPYNRPTSECSTCSGYFRSRYYQHLYRPNDEKEAMVILAVRELRSLEKEAMMILAVRELRSLELYRNDLTSKGLTEVLDKCPQLEPLDVWNCLSIVRNNNNALRATPEWNHRFKAKKLTTKLLMRSNPNVFNPECLDDIRNCRIMVMNSYHGRIIMDSTLGAKYKSVKLRRRAKKHQQRTRKMKAKIERYIMVKQLILGHNVDFMEFEGVEFKTSCYRGNHWEFHDLEEFDFERGRGSITSECSTCLMFEYLAGRWGVLDLDDYSDYYDLSYGLDVYDEIEFQVHDRMVGKRFRRYLKME